MHPLEHRLITQDPDLPGLALLHDDDALSAALRTHDPGIHRARVHYLRYKPHTHCLAALHLEHHDGKQSHAYAKALPRASHDWDWQQRRLHKRHGGIRLALAAHHLLIASPEHDRRLNPDLPPEATILRYKPERRLVARLGAHLLRYHTTADYPAILRAATTGAAVGGAPIHSTDASHASITTAWLEGDTLHHADAATAAHIGACIARIQQSPADHLPHTTPADEQHSLAQTLATIDHLHPALTPAVAALIRQSGRALAHDNPAPCLSHGDLSLDQIIHSPDDTYHLIDWDNACRATPDADLATLIGKTLAHTPTTNAHTLRDALLDGYARPINRHSLHWRTIAALIRLIPEPYRRRDPAWPDTMRARLEQTAQIAAQP